MSWKENGGAGHGGGGCARERERSGLNLAGGQSLSCGLRPPSGRSMGMEKGQESAVCLRYFKEKGGREGEEID